MTNTLNEASNKTDIPTNKVPTHNDVKETYYYAHDAMVRDIQQGFSKKFDDKAADTIISAMDAGSMTPDQAMKALMDLGAEPRTSTKAVEKAATKGTEIKGDANRDQANSIYEAIADYRSNFYTKVQVEAATVIIIQMQDNKITPAIAIEQLQKI